MTPLLIIKDIIEISKLIHQQVQLVKSNMRKVKALSATIENVVSAIQDLDMLHQKDNFISNLNRLKAYLEETKNFIEQLPTKNTVHKVIGDFFHAQEFARKIDALKAQILDILPFLTVGLLAQGLIDKEKELDRENKRRNEEQDRQELKALQEQLLRQKQPPMLSQEDVTEIVRRQWASIVDCQNQRTEPSPIVEQSIIPKDFIVQVHELDFTARIGESDLGNLYSGILHRQPVTIKWVEGIVSERDRKHFIEEVIRMTTLHNGYIMPIYGACFEEGRLCFVTGSMEAGDLSKALSILSSTEQLRMAQDLANGLCYLHDLGIVHGDIQPSNIGVNEDHRGKWMNIGLIHTLTTSLNSRNKKQQEVSWLAPEAWNRSFEPSAESDIFGFGCLLWSLMTGRLCEGATAKEAMPIELSEESKDLILACWGSSSRPTAHEIAERLQHLTERQPLPTAEACYENGNKAYEAGNVAEAWTWYSQACQQNYTKAYTSTGLFRLEGLGGQTKDKNQGIADLKRAALGGHARAMFNLGRVYKKGNTEEGIPDYVKALHWYTKAAEADPTDKRATEEVEVLKQLLNPHQSDYQFRSHAFGK